MLATILPIILLASVALGLLAGQRLLRRRGRRVYIEDYRFHPALDRELETRHPQLDAAQRRMVFQGLRDFFHLCHEAKGRHVAMPSQVVDDAWHGFILHTRAYDAFCRRALGRFLHHTPAEAMASATVAREGIKRAWRLACAREGIDPKAPDRLPLLFALDARLAIANGFRYVPDCRAAARGDAGVYCASHIGCSGGCAGDCGDASAEGADGGGCGGD